MIKENWEQILRNQDVRQNLSKIRQEIKEEGALAGFTAMIQGSEDKLAVLLESKDAKTRKNAALLMGDMGKQEFLGPVWDAYQREEQRFVKSSYLKAIGNFDYREQADDIREQLELLRTTEVTEETQKHNMEELRELSALLVRIEGVRSHEFTGWDAMYEVVLLTNRNYAGKIQEELLERQPEAKTKFIGAGVMARVKDLKWVREIRTYQELLFMVRGMKATPMVPEQVADMVVKSGLMPFLRKAHEGSAPYYFRVELKSKTDLKKKSVFIKKLSAEIEKKSGRKLINTKDHYEFELRLIENKQGECNVLIKLFTMKDKRFAYREDVVPTSIRPTNAALTVALAKDYLQEDAQILDPFCGAGTMLIERKKAVQAKTAYGLDIQEEAILKARKNTENAGQIVHYINRDFFTFEHEYQFDEVITNMPFQIGRMTEEEVFELYVKFFKTVPSVLKDGAVMVLYSHDIEYIRYMTEDSEFRILEQFELSKREGTCVVVLRYKG